MIYIIVLFGSLFALLLFYILRSQLKKRKVSSFVQGVQERSSVAIDKGLQLPDIIMPDHIKAPRKTSKEMQELRQLVRKADFIKRSGDIEEVEKLLIQALRMDPGNISVRATLAAMYLDSNRPFKAEMIYKEIVQTMPEKKYVVQLGHSQYALQKYQDAYTTYAQAFSYDTRDYELMKYIGYCLHKIGENQDAIDYLERCSLRLWRDVELLETLAHCYECMGDKAQALHSYGRIHKVQPYNKNIKAKIHALAH